MVKLKKQQLIAKLDLERQVKLREMKHEIQLAELKAASSEEEEEEAQAGSIQGSIKEDFMKRFHVDCEKERVDNREISLEMMIMTRDRVYKQRLTYPRYP